MQLNVLSMLITVMYSNGTGMQEYEYLVIIIEKQIGTFESVVILKRCKYYCLKRTDLSDS